jgi:hypothetical protein
MSWWKRIWCRHEWDVGAVVATSRPSLKMRDYENVRVSGASMWHFRALLEGTTTHRVTCSKCGATDVSTALGQPETEKPPG